VADADSDQDGDGASDVAEYTALTDPNNWEDLLKVLEWSYTKDLSHIKVKFTSSLGRMYLIESSDDLVKWKSSALSVVSPDEGGATCREVENPGGSRDFGKVTVLLPLGGSSVKKASRGTLASSMGRWLPQCGNYEHCPGDSANH
jgi:hypothetical protein